MLSVVNVQQLSVVSVLVKGMGNKISLGWLVGTLCVHREQRGREGHSGKPTANCETQETIFANVIIPPQSRSISRQKLPETETEINYSLLRQNHSRDQYQPSKEFTNISPREGSSIRDLGTTRATLLCLFHCCFWDIT